MDKAYSINERFSAAFGGSLMTFTPADVPSMKKEYENMENNIKRFLEGLNGKTVALCGIGGSNLPLIGLFGRYGAHVLACDKRERAELGENADQAEEKGNAQKLMHRPAHKNIEHLCQQQQIHVFLHNPEC